MAEQPVTRYATGSGAHIAYQVLGHGPALVIVPGFASHLEVEWEDGACRSFIRRLAAFATVVRFDKRGTGLSDPVQELPTLQERDADLAAVIAAAGADRPVLLGYSEGGSIAVRFAVTHDESVRGLILYGASAHRPPPWAMEQLRMAAAAWGTGASIELFARSQAGDPGARSEQARFERASASPAMARALVESLTLVDVESLLSRIRVPALVVHRTQDVIPVEEGRFLASRIPSSRFRELAGVDHRPWAGDSQAVIDEIERFLVWMAPVLAESSGPASPDAVVRRGRRPDGQALPNASRRLLPWRLRDAPTRRSLVASTSAVRRCRRTSSTSSGSWASTRGRPWRSWPPTIFRPEIPDLRDARRHPGGAG